MFVQSGVASLPGFELGCCMMRLLKNVLLCRIILQRQGRLSPQLLPAPMEQGQCCYLPFRLSLLSMRTYQCLGRYLFENIVLEYFVGSITVLDWF